MDGGFSGLQESMVYGRYGNFKEAVRASFNVNR